jgi:hypothetical protein
MATDRIMRPVLQVLAAGSLLAIGFVSGAVVWDRIRLEPSAQVTLKNESGQAIRDLKLTNSTAGQKSTILLPALNQDESTTIKFFLMGEGSYQVEATLADGRLVKGGEGYVESGYQGTKVVRATEITQ